MGRRPALVFVIFAGAFAAIAAGVLAHGRLARFDVEVSSWFAYHRTAGVTQAARLVTALGGWRVLTGLSVLVGLYWTRRRAWGWLLALVLTVPAGSLVCEVLKDTFHRARPQWEHPLVAVAGFSFPSGHAMAATTFCQIFTRRNCQILDRR